MKWIKNRKPNPEDSPILATGEIPIIEGYLNVSALHWLSDGWNGAGWYDHSNEYGMKEEEIKYWMHLSELLKDI